MGGPFDPRALRVGDTVEEGMCRLGVEEGKDRTETRGRSILHLGA